MISNITSKRNLKEILTDEEIIIEEYSFEDIPFINNGIHSLLNKDEICVLKYDENYLYVFGGPEHFSKVLSKIILNNRRITFSGESKPQYFCLGENDEKPKVITSAYRIHRNIAYVKKSGVTEMDILSLVKKYKNNLSLEDLFNRVKERIQTEWNEIHGNKRPT